MPIEPSRFMKSTISLPRPLISIYLYGVIPSKSLLDYFFKYNTSKYAFFGISVGAEDEFFNSIYPASVPIVTPFILIF